MLPPARHEIGVFLEQKAPNPIVSGFAMTEDRRLSPEERARMPQQQY
jgi:hypothetical protein